jgi:sucrose-6-phosphate hydrolase SacC (GH32 family)
MLLQKKQSAQLEVERERRKQIDEGLALAQRIDGLRRTLAQLETQHSLYISKMQRELEDMTKPLIDKVVSLKKEIALLEEKRIKESPPLDAQWAKVRQKETDVNSLASKFNLKLAELSKKEEQLGIKEQELKESRFKVKTQERELKKAHDKAEEDLFIIKESKKEAQRLENKALQFAKKTEQEARELKAKVIIESQEVSIKQKQVDDKEQELIIKEIVLRDREETLDREIKRQK